MQDKDFEWFLNNYEQLFIKYGDSYLAIKNGAVLGCYPSYAKGVRETQKTEPLGSFIIQHCNGNPSGYTVAISTVGLA